MTTVAGLAERLKVSDLPRLLDELKEGGPSPPRHGAFLFVAGVFAEQNPRAAWDYALALPPGPLRQQMLAAAAQALSASDAPAALALAETLADPALKSQLRNSALMQLAARDPRRAAELAMQSRDEGGLPLSFVYMRWAEKDPSGAWESASRLGGDRGWQAQSAVLNALAQSDPAKAWDLARKDASTLPDIIESVVRIWSGSDPEGALRAAESLAPGATRSRAIGAALQNWGRQNPRAAAQYAAGVADPILRSDLLRQLSMGPVAEPEILFSTLLESMPPGENFQQAAASIISNWARQDPRAAAAAIFQLPPGRMVSNAAAQVASIWASSGAVAEAMAWARSLPEGHARVAAVESVLREVAASNPRRALEMAAGLPEKENREALREIGRAWSRQNPAEALDWAGRLADAGLRGDVMRFAITEWAQNSPAEAAAYAAKLPESERAGPLQGAVERWAARDAESAAQWLQSLPASPSKDGAQAALARQIATEDPETGLAWAAALHDPRRRERTIEQIAREWLRQEPEAARAWISRSQLPSPLREKLLK